MKNIFLLFILILTANINAQDKIYVSEKYGNALKLILKADGTYQLVYNEGTYKQNPDSVYLNPGETNIENFTAIPVKVIGDKDSLELSFTNDGGYLSTYNIAIATSSGDDNNLMFYPLSYYQTNTMDSYSDNLYKLTIKKEKILYVAKKNYTTNKTEVSKFAISDDVNGLLITENYNVSSNLVAVYNEKGNLVVSENGASPVEFVLQEKLVSQEKPKGLKSTSLNNINIDWNFTSLYNDNSYDSYVTPETVEVKVETSLKEALKNLKANPQSCLLIVNESKKVFDQFVSIHKTAYNDLKYYDETDKNIYEFVFYNLKEDEQTWLEKNNYSKNTKLIVLGLNENVIYSTEQSVSKLGAEGYYSYEYINLARQIKSVANLCLVNENLLNKKNSVQQLKSALYNASVSLNHRSLFPDENEDYAITTSANPSTNDSDSDNEHSDYTSPAKLRGVYYKSKVTKQDVDAIWNKVLNQYTKETDYDKELFHTIYKELNNEGFSMNLFGEQRYVMNENDFRAFDYLLKHYMPATSAENYSADYNYDYSTYYPALSDVKYLISNVLSRNLSDGYDVNPTMEQKKEIIKRYGKYLYDSPNDHYMLSTYVYSLAANKNDDELFSFYENFVSRFDTKNIIESLDKYYADNYELNWYDLKTNFSNMANTVSWYVVENKIKDTNRIKKAIEWSEMSIKLSRNNSYYMDTLAQLYFMNGDKQKAIVTQEEAIKNYKDAEINPDTLSEMKSVLEKMKTGSYK